MAYVTLFVPQDVVDLPTKGTIQYHPSLLPLHRGPSSINWPIIMGRKQTGLTIFEPDEGLDEGPVILQKTVDIGPDDTLGSLYFDHLFPMGVEAMCECVDLVREGKAKKVPQDHSKATYESWCRKADAEIDWSKPVDEVYNLIRGTNPQPGAWTTCNGNELKIFDSRKVDGSGEPGTVLAVDGDSFTVAAKGGAIRVDRVRPHDDKKISAGDFAAKAGVSAGAKLGG
jgi:methionyl-tRNA formyltransferase